MEELRLDMLLKLQNQIAEVAPLVLEKMSKGIKSLCPVQAHWRIHCVVVGTSNGHEHSLRMSLPGMREPSSMLLLDNAALLSDVSDKAYLLADLWRVLEGNFAKEVRQIC